MNIEPNTRKCCKCLTVVGVAGSFLVMAWLVWLMRSYTQPPALAQVRAEERLKIKHEFDEANAPLLKDYDWVDKSKGFLRIPVEQAKDLILQEWKDPAAGRSILTNRAAKAFAPAVAVKNPYE